MDGEAFGKDYPHACLSCGLLGFISPKPNYPGVHELDASRRWYGERLSANARLWCFQRMANIQREVEEVAEHIRETNSFQPESDQHTERAQAMREVFCKPRPECMDRGVWHQYVDFLDPKWHYEDWRAIKLEELRRASEEALRSVLEESKRIAEDHKHISELSGKEAFRWQVAFFVMAFLAIVLALAPLAYPNGIERLVDIAPGAERSITPSP